MSLLSSNPVHSVKASPANGGSPEEAFGIDVDFGFTLYNAVQSVRKSYRPYLDHLGLTYSQYLVLVVLWKTNGLTVSELGHHLNLETGTLTPMLKRLEAAGLLRRARRVTDEREVEVRLTDAGRALHADGLRAHRGFMSRLGLTPAQIEDMRGSLRRIIAQLDAAVADEPVPHEVAHIGDMPD